MKSLREWIQEQIKMADKAIRNGSDDWEINQSVGEKRAFEEVLEEFKDREDREESSESYVFAGPRMAPILNALCLARRDILHEKWYEQDFPNLTWLGFLLETMGEIAHTSTRESGSLEDLRVKVCGIAAISVSWLEYIEDRKQGGADE